MTAQRITIPGELFPAFPAVSLPQLADWQPVAVPGAYIGVSRPGDPTFTPTVLVTVERWTGEVTLAEALAAQRARMRGAGQRETAVHEENGEARLRAEQRDPQIARVELRYRILPLPRGAVTDVVTIVGTASWRQMPGLGAQIDAILADTRVTAEPAG